MLLSRKLAFSISELPAELRTLIFEHLTIEDTPVKPGRFRLWSGHLTQHLNGQLKNNHWLQRKFMHPLTPEIVNTWFKTNTFHVSDSSVLGVYFAEDEYCKLRLTKKKPIIPAHLLRHLIVELRGEIGEAEPLGPYQPRWICGDLERLFTLKHPERLRLEIQMSANSTDRLEVLLAMLEPVRDKLVEAGIKVCVTCKNPSELGYPASLDAYYSGSADDWAEIVAETTYEAFHSDDTDFDSDMDIDTDMDTDTEIDTGTDTDTDTDSDISMD
jgi:hypothetical protein